MGRADELTPEERAEPPAAAHAQGANADALLASIIETSDDAIISKDLNGVITSWNGAAERLYGYTAAEVIGQPVSIIIPTDKRGEMMQILEQIKRGERVDHFETVRVCRDGQRVEVSLTVSPVKDAAGQIIGASKIARNIAERKRAAEGQRFLAEASTALSFSLDYERTLASIAQMAVPGLADWCTVDMLDENGALKRLAVAHVDPSKVAWAHELEERFPVDMDAPRGVPQVVRTGASELYPDIPDAMLVEAVKDEEQLRLLRSIGFSSAMIVPLIANRRTLGTISFISAESHHHYDMKDLALAEDLARRAALAIDNARLYSAAQEANRIKDEFLATLSHELRTPLTAILGWAVMLRTNELNEESIKRGLESIERNARTQTQIVEDVLDISRIITGKLRLDIRPLDLAPVLRSSVDTMRPTAAAKGIELRMWIERDAGPVAGDPARLQQIIWNLLSNAVKFTPQGGSVELRFERGDAFARLVLSDTGIGIDRNFLPYVFDRFRQADGSISRRHGGLGLGLAIVRHLVELHGGTVRAESDGVGRGSTFTVELPLGVPSASIMSEPEEVPRAAVAESAEPAIFDCAPSLQNLSVLIVDDEPDTRLLLTTMLENCGAQVVAAQSAQEALSALSQQRPDVLVSDIGLPDEDGYALIRKVRALKPEEGGRIPAVALSAYAREEDRVRALVSGYHIHVAKPVNPAELIAVIGSLARLTKRE